VVDVYTTYIPNRYPNAKRTRKSDGGAGSVNNDHTLNLLHELRRHLRDRGVCTVERVRAQLGDVPSDKEIDIAVDVSARLPLADSQDDDQLLEQSDLASSSPPPKSILERHPPVNGIAQPLLSELFSKVRSAQNVPAAAVFGSDSDNDSDR